MRNQTCILIDDEVHALATLVDIIQKVPGLVIFGQYASGMAALVGLKEKGQVDFIFSDIEMPGLSGIEAAKLLRPYCRYLIFTTAHGHYALDAFGEDAEGFILKPLNLTAVLEKVEKIRQKEKAGHSMNNEIQSDSLFVKTGSKYGYTRIAYKDIVCVDSGDHYPTIVTVSDRILVYMSMNELASHLADKGNFVRIHKTCIISVDKISYIDGNTLYLDLAKNNIREIGQSYRKEFFDIVNRLALISTKSKSY